MTLTFESGYDPQIMVMEFTPGKTGIDTKVNGIQVLNTKLGLTFSSLVILTLVIMQMGNLMAKANTHGQVVQSILEISKRD